MESKGLLFLFILALLAPSWVNPSPVPDGKNLSLVFLSSAQIVLEHNHIELGYHHVTLQALPAFASLLIYDLFTVCLNFQVIIELHPVKC